MALTEMSIKNARAQDKSYQMPDQGGLYLEIKPNGSKLWRFRYRFHGKERRLGLGEYPYIRLKQARGIHAQMRQQIANGQDPKLIRDAEQAADEKLSTNTFGVVAREWLDVNRDKWDPGQ